MFDKIKYKINEDRKCKHVFPSGIERAAYHQKEVLKATKPTGQEESIAINKDSIVNLKSRIFVRQRRKNPNDRCKEMVENNIENEMPTKKGKEAKGISLTRVSADAFEDLPPTEVRLLLVQQAKAEACDLLVRLKSSTHCLAIRVMKDGIFIIDSRQTHPCPLSIADAAHFIEGHSRHHGAEDIVVKLKT
ncbi:unnamed protein product [Mytilus edulis]|uniref:Uncharacterized protein n=1 Tax=Mytilus edulis TaxID=6550 RepID=A0A8S3UA85_MYTED|nr:unnamed protein product [Mytilus edulis]